MFNDSKLSYFLLPTRAGELILGGIVAIWRPKFHLRRSNKELLALLGILTILFCSLFINKSTPFPGTWSLLPCFAALLVILFADGTTVSRLLLENRVFVHLGRLSYGMYLWHWPIVAYMIYLGVDFELENQILAVLLTYFLSLSSYYLVENPIRYSNFNWSQTVKIFLMLPVSIITVFYAMNWNLDGFKNRFTSQDLKPLYGINDLSYFREGVCFLSNDFPDFYTSYNKDTCGKLSKNITNVLLLGDSHSAHLYYGLSQAFSEQKNIVQATTSGCKVDVDAKNVSRCKDLYHYIFSDYLVKYRSEIKEVWIASRWEKEDKDKAMAVIQRVKAINSKIKVVVLGPLPEYDFDLPKLMALDNIFNRSLVFKSLRKAPHEVDEYFSEQFQNKIENVSYISLYKLLCTNNKCSYFTSQGSPMQFDYGHLTKDGSIYLAKKIKEKYEK